MTGDDRHSSNEPMIEVTCSSGHVFRVSGTAPARTVTCPVCNEIVDLGKRGLEAVDRTPADDLPTTLMGPDASPIPQRVTREAPRTLGRFELLGVLGEGAFGTVYRARDPRLERVVALKIPRAGSLPSGQETDLFLREARAAARLRHPNIVPVFEAGQIDDCCYIASALIEGQTVRSAVKAGWRPSYDETAQLMAQLATALHYAHGQGIVHRDIKPANVMLDADGTPLIMDFGLARREGDDVFRTREGMQLGTPAYMSPEQAMGRSHQADARSDLWSLGVMLYELLTGWLPFRGKDVGELVRAVCEQEPASPRKIDARVPKDLETICLRCLSKEPAARYASCQDLAEEIRRWQRGEPIQARPVGVGERCWRWSKRNPRVALLSAAVLLLTVVGSWAVWYFAGQAELSARKSERVTEIAARREKENVAAQQEAERARQEKRQADKEREEAARQAKEALGAQAALESVQQRTDYFRLINLGFEAWESGAVQKAESLAQDCPKPLRHWEWHRLQRLCNLAKFTLLPNGMVDSLAWSPDGAFLATAGRTGNVEIWNAATGQRAHLLGEERRVIPARDPRPFSLDWSPDGKCLAMTPRADHATDARGDSQPPQSLRIWNRDAGVSMIEIAAHDGDVRQVAWSHDSRRLAAIGTHDGGVQIWDVRTGRLQNNLVPANETAACFAWDSRNERLAVGYPGGPIGLLSSATGEENAKLEFAAHSLEFLSSPMGELLLVASSADGVTHVWRLSSPAPPTVIEHKPDPHVVCSPDGSRVATFAPQAGPARVWGLATGRLLYTVGPAAGVTGLAWTKDASRLATVGQDDPTVKVWDGLKGDLLFELRGHRLRGLTSAAWCPDGVRLATVDSSEVKVWDARSDPAIRILTIAGQAPESRMIKESFGGPGGRPVVVITPYPVRVERPAPGVTVQRPDLQAPPRVGPRETALPGCLLPAAWDFPSRRLAVGSEDLEIWDVDTGVRLFHAKAAHDVLMYPSTAKNGIHSLRWSRDGQRVVTCDFLGTAKLWDLEAGHEPRVFKLVRSAWALCPDLLLAVQAVRDTANGPTQLRVWDFKSDSLRTSLQVDDNVPLYALSDNGRWLAVKTSDNRLRVHDLATGELIRELTGPGGVRLFQWRDEQLLAFGPKADFKRWDIASGKELQSFDGIRDWLCWSASLSPDGQRLVVVDSDGIPKIVDTESGKVVMSLSGHQSPVFTVAWSPDGTRIATVSSGQVRIWDSVSRLDDAGASATASSPETSVAAPTISTPGQRDAPNPKNKARGKRRRSTG